MRWQAKGVIAFYAANSVGDDIEVYESDSTRGTALETFYTLRQQADTDSDTCVRPCSRRASRRVADNASAAIAQSAPWAT